MIPQQGLASLPQAQQGPMPGQAPMPGMMPGMTPGMMPQQGAPTPQAMTGSLKNMPLEQLKMLYQNPQPGSPPLWAVISALAEKQKEAQAMMAAQGQSAMAQNAQMQQQPPVAAQVVQAAEQMAPQGYAGGGAVAFRDAGVVGLQNPEYDEEGLPRTNEERQRIERNNRIFLEQQRNVEAQKQLQAQKARVRETSGVVPQQQLDFYRSTGRDRPVTLGMQDAGTPAMSAPMRMQDTRGGTPEMAALAQMLGSGASTAPSPAPAGPRMQPPAPAAQPALAPQAGLSPEMEAYFRNRMSDLRTREGLPEDVLVGRAGLEALARANIEAQKSEAKTYGDEIRAARDAALARAQRGILDDPQALLALAGSIDTRKGQGIGSLARGAAGLMSQREAAAEAAREKYATAQQTERALQANVRQATMLEAQRAQALREGDFNRANQIKDQIDALMMQRETLLMERKDKAIEQARQERLARATETQAQASMVQAGKPPGEIALMQWLQDPKNRKMYEDIQSSKREEDRMVKLYEIYSKNKLMLGNPTFEDFVAGFKTASGAASGAAPGRQLKYNPATGKIE